MPRRRFGTFSGGINLPAEKDATLDAAIAPWPVQELRIPLCPLPAAQAQPVVAPGDKVKPGQLLARTDDPQQVNVYAPLAGVVGDFTDVLVPDDFFGWRSSRAIVLKDLQPASQPNRPDFDWEHADAAELLERLREGHLLLCSGPFDNVSRWLESAIESAADTLICNVMENAPLVTADHRLLAERGGDVVRGLAILAKALSVAHTMLAVDSQRTGAYRSAARLAGALKIDTIALAPKYPIEAQAMLTQVLTRRQVVPGRSTLSVRVAMVDAATCAAAYQWAALGLRQTHRVVTMAGRGVKSPGNYLIPFGTDAAWLLAQACESEPPLRVHGSPMNGRELAVGAVVGPRTNALLGMEDSYAGPPTPCIRCGWCSDNCPARLNVAALNDDFELAHLDGAKARCVTACVGCGICTYLCPARLPLMSRCQQLRQMILREAKAATP